MNQLRTTALRLLFRRDHSKVELFNKLLLRNFPEDEITATLKQLEQESLLNEDRFIGNFIRSRRFKGHGPTKICAELGKHDIDHHRIWAHEEWQEIDWQQDAVRARVKRFGRTLPRDAKAKATQFRFLIQRGFTSAQVRFALTDQSLMSV